MKKIIPFKKDIIFKTNLAEITSISLEHTLEVEKDSEINGNFVVSGEYKIADTSINVEPFTYELPFHITMDDKYILNNVKVDIDDFYYEIVNSSILSINIEVLIDNLEEKLIPEIKNDIENKDSELELNIIDTPESITDTIEVEEVREDNIEEERCIEAEDDISSLFDNMSDTSETYKSYKIYIVREGDNLESIIEKYNVSKESLEEYNDLKELKIGDKIIISS